MEHQAYAQENVPLPDESAFVAAHREDIPPPTMHTTATRVGRAATRGSRGRKGGRGHGRENQESGFPSNVGRRKARSRGRGGRGSGRSRGRGGRVHEDHIDLNLVPDEISLTQTHQRLANNITFS